MSYADLEPFYDHAEYELGVSGKAGNLQGRKIDGGNVFEAARRRDYPLPPLLLDQSGIMFDEAARKLGYHPFSTPRAILSQPYNGRPGCTYCGFCQAFGCHVGAKSSILVTKLPEADATGNFKLVTGAMAYRVNSDNSGRATGVSYYGPGGSDNTVEADLVILTTFIYDNVRLLLLSKTDKYPERARQLERRGRQAPDGAHDAERVRPVRRPLRQQLHGPERAEAHDRRLQRRQLRPRRPRLHPRRADLDRHAEPRGRPARGHHDLRRRPACRAGAPPIATSSRKSYARHGVMVAQTENLPYADQTIDLDPNVRDAWGLPAPRLTYDWRRPNELKRVEFMQAKMEEIGRAMGGQQVWRTPVAPGFPGAHHEGGTRMGTDPKTSVVNRYGQSWDIPNLFVVGSSTFPTMGTGFNPTLTIQALAYHERGRDREPLSQEPGGVAVAEEAARRSRGKLRGRRSARSDFRQIGRQLSPDGRDIRGLRPRIANSFPTSEIRHTRRLRARRLDSPLPVHGMAETASGRNRRADLRDEHPFLGW